jgi:GrpB-like predicted nucleotidyltransferase (UPF0157 family)
MSHEWLGGYARRVLSPRITLEPYDPAWSQAFEAERMLLERVLAPWLRGGVHHVGSTAVPDIRSKPIVDVIAGVSDLEIARGAFEPLGEHEYVYTPHRPDIAHHFSKPSARLFEATHGLHLTEPGSALWRERLTFRDRLRADPVLAREYEALKVKLANDHPGDVDAYTKGKRALVARVLAGAGIALRPS